MWKLLILGNFQAKALSTLFAGITDKNGDHLFEVLPCAPVPQLDAEQGPRVLELVKQCDVLLYQPHAGVADTPRWRLSSTWCELAGGETISFRPLYFGAYHPELIQLDNGRGASLHGRFGAYHDRRIVTAYLQGAGRQETARHFLADCLDGRFIRTNAEASLAELDRAENELNPDIRISEFLRRRYRQQQLFVAPDRPANAMLKEVCRQVLRRLGVRPRDVGFISPRGQLLARNRYPITEQTRTELNLEFEPFPGYRIRGESCTPAELVAGHFDFYELHPESFEERREEVLAKSRTPRPRVVLHIGLSKTGTTSLQHCLFENRQSLRRSGLLYPAVGLVAVAHFELCHHLAGVNRRDSLMEELLTEFDRSGCSTLVLSAELFESLGTQQMESIQAVFSDFDVHIVCCLRDRVAWISSMYNEIVKKAAYRKDFQALLAGDGGMAAGIVGRLRTRDFLQQWISVFGADRVHVYRYQPGRNLDSFFKAIDGEMPVDLCEKADKAANTSVSMTTIGVLRRYFLDRGIEDLDYGEASRLAVRTHRALAERGFDLSSNSAFGSIESVSSFIAEYLEHDVYVGREFGFEISGLNHLSRLKFVDEANTEQIYRASSDLLRDVHDRVRAELA